MNVWFRFIWVNEVSSLIFETGFEEVTARGIRGLISYFFSTTFGEEIGDKP